VKELWKILKIAYVDFKTRRQFDIYAPVIIPPVLSIRSSPCVEQEHLSLMKFGSMKIVPSEICPDTERI
jgi:hypothetical protein